MSERGLSFRYVIEVIKQTLGVLFQKWLQCSAICSLSLQQGLGIIRIDVTRPERSGHSTPQLGSFVNDELLVVLLMRLNPRKGHFT